MEPKKFTNLYNIDGHKKIFNIAIVKNRLKNIGKSSIFLPTAFAKWKKIYIRSVHTEDGEKYIF